jgi:hypothetical protein
MIKLSDILADMLARAEAEPRKPQRRKLQRGLHLEVTFEVTRYHFRIWRDSGVPSPVEWTACMNAWPWFVRIDPALSQQSVPPYLHARIEVEQDVQLKFL